MKVSGREAVAALFGENGTAAEAPEPRLSSLLAEIEGLFLTYVELEQKELATLLAIWIVQSYALECFAFCGFVSLQSASPRCGKSRVLDLLSFLLADSPMVTTHPTAAVLFRSKKKTLVLDEVDGLRNKDKDAHGDLMSILNCAFKRGAVVERVAKTKEGFVVEQHDAYRAVALAGLEKLSDALTDRAFVIRMKRADHRMPRLNPRALEDKFRTLKSKIWEWVDARKDEIEELYAGLPNETPQLAGRDDRLQDIAEGLLTIALLADTESPQANFTTKLIAAIDSIDNRRERSNREEQLLAFLEIAQTHLGESGEVFIETHTLLENCQDTESLSWIESGRKLSTFLKHFDLCPFKKSGKVRGYQITAEWVEEWGKRYR